MSITLNTYGSLGLNLAVGVVLPMLVALVTKQTASGALKAILLAALSAVSGLVQAWIAVGSGQPFDLGAAGTTALISFVWAVVAHYGILKPVSLTGSTGAIQVKLPWGLG